MNKKKTEPSKTELDQMPEEKACFTIPVETANDVFSLLQAFGELSISGGRIDPDYRQAERCAHALAELETAWKSAPSA